MDRDRNRRIREGSRDPQGAVPPGPPPRGRDAIGKLDAVLATLEEMLDERGAPAAPLPRGDRAAGEDPLPVLEDVAVPAAGESFDGGPLGREAAGPRPKEPPPSGGRAPSEAQAPSRREAARDEDDGRPRFGDLRLVAGRGSAASDRERYGGAPPPVLEPEAYRHLVDRLANEIDVIVQTETEKAMRRAAADVIGKIGDHVAIVLPELIEELVRMSNRPPD